MYVLPTYVPTYTLPNNISSLDCFQDFYKYVRKSRGLREERKMLRRYHIIVELLI